MKNKCLEHLTITKRNERKMEKIKSDQEKVLKEILGKNWKNIPQINGIEWNTFGVKIKDGNVIGLDYITKS